ncbi:MAG: hypothetical protein IT357_15525, partial [Gemmatimonadaceae bacterium]|nr:hypothetical protein [Gemmatimonadaceae bacterium]
MSRVRFAPAEALLLGRKLNDRVAEAGQRRQRAEVEEILRRFREQPGVILADEVGMGKTFVALGVAVSVALSEASGPVIVMAPPALLTKWAGDLKAFAELYVEDATVCDVAERPSGGRSRGTVIRFGVARHSIDLMRLLDDAPRERAHLIFLAQGAMRRKQTDKWIRLALVAETLRRHARGGAKRLIAVKAQIHRFMAPLISALGEERQHDLGEQLWNHLLSSAPESWRETYNAEVTDQDAMLRDDPVPKAIARVLQRGDLDLKPLADALAEMPLRARGTEAQVRARIKDVQSSLRELEGRLWADLLHQARWRSPLLILDEAHHLKNV